MINIYLETQYTPAEFTFKPSGSLLNCPPLELLDVIIPAFLYSLRLLLKQSSNLPFAAFFKVGPRRKKYFNTNSFQITLFYECTYHNLCR